jgi:tRNA threonylcarbamoyladenosine biosynthesis protein TsaE
MVRQSAREETYVFANVFSAAMAALDATMRAVTRNFTSHSAEDTVELGRQLAAQLRNAHVVLLRGDLGTGKTTLVKGIAEGFGAAEADDVTSPTFALIQEYHGPDKHIFHIDLYRLDKQGELDALGLEDLLLEERNLLLIEWGEKFPRVLQQKDAEIVIRRVSHDERTVRLTTGT